LTRSKEGKISLSRAKRFGKLLREHGGDEARALEALRKQDE
jgi:hypothetical protein